MLTQIFREVCPAKKVILVFTAYDHKLYILPRPPLFPSNGLVGYLRFLMTVKRLYKNLRNLFILNICFPYTLPYFEAEKKILQSFIKAKFYRILF